jgi:hypothetical protein
METKPAAKAEPAGEAKKLTNPQDILAAIRRKQNGGA